MYKLINDIEIAHRIRQGELHHSSELSQTMNLFFQSWFHHDTKMVMRLKKLPNIIQFI